MGVGFSQGLEARVTDRKSLIKDQLLSRRNYLRLRPSIGRDGRLIVPKESDAEVSSPTTASTNGGGSSGSKNSGLSKDQGSYLPFLDENILPIVIEFLFGGSLLKCFEVSPLWYCCFLETMDQMHRHIDDDFRRALPASALILEYSRTDWSPVHTSTIGTRIDRVLIAKVGSTWAGKSIRLAYDYTYSSIRNQHKSKQELNETRFECPFQFDVVRASSNRNLWIHKDICRFHGDETRVAAMQNITPVRVGDRIEIAVNLYNAYGKTALQSIRWFPAKLTIAPEIRKCPLEEDLEDWYDLDTFQAQSVERLQIPDFFSPQLMHQNTEYAGLDIAVSRTQLVASNVGVVPQADRILGSRFEVLPRNAPIILPLKRIGLQHDRFTKIQLREGDRLHLYISQGGRVT